MKSFVPQEFTLNKKRCVPVLFQKVKSNDPRCALYTVDWKHHNIASHMHTVQQEEQTGKLSTHSVDRLAGKLFIYMTMLVIKTTNDLIHDQWAVEHMF